MKPLNYSRLRKRALIQGLALWGSVVLLSLIWGRCTELAADGQTPGISFLAIINQILDNPLTLLTMFPRTAAGWTYGFYGMVLGILAPLKTYDNYIHKKDLRPSKENGSAKWNEDLKSFTAKYTDTTLRIGTGSKNMIMTEEIQLSMDTRKTRRNNNVLVIGGSGTGKSRFLVIPNLMQANCSFVVTDPSGELLEAMGSFLEDQGYEIKVFNLIDMERSDNYNPFRYVRNDEGILTMITALIANTNPKGSKPSDPFWEKAETALLEAICFLIYHNFKDEEKNFSYVMKLLRMAEAEEGQKSALDNLFESEDANSLAAKCYAVYKSAGGGKTAQSIVISAQTRLHTFNLPAIEKLTNTDTIDLGSLGDKKTALFCLTPTADTTFNYLVGLMYTQLFETLYNKAETKYTGKRLPYHVRFLLDEFANIGTIPDFCQKLATMRKYEISCTVILQALSQLKALYKDDWEVIIGNCDSLLFLGATDKTTLEYISAILGKETIRSLNTTRSYGKQGSFTTNYNKVGRELMTPDELKIMDNEACIYFLRGLEPFYATKFNVEHHPNFKKTGVGDPDKRYPLADKKSTKGVTQ